MKKHQSQGCFNLPCGRKEYPIKDDLLDSSLEEDCTVKHDLVEFTSEDLSRFTCQFSPENLIGLTHLGKLYHGKMPNGSVTEDVAVKILVDDERLYMVNADDKKLSRLEDELKFLLAPKIRVHPNLVKVIGCCREDENLGVVYDINPRDTLHNLIIHDDFSWLQRFKTAVALARLLAYLHDGKHLIRNFSPSHIVLDQEYTPVLFEFGLLVGGVLGNTIDESDRRLGPFGYIDPFSAARGPATFTVKSDVYAFGALLLNLISKRVVDKEDPLAFAVNRWAIKEYNSGYPLVHISVKEDPDFDPRDEPKIAKLAIQCMDNEQKKRPEMKEVFERLKGLRCCAAAQ